MASLHALQAERWAQQHFGQVRLGDRRRNRRAVTIAAGMASHTGKSIPALFDRVSDIKAAYTFFDRPETTPERLQEGHRNQVHQAMHQAGTFLLLEDSSEVIWSRAAAIDGLGKVGDLKSERRQGFTLHTALAVRWTAPVPGSARRLPVTILGLAHQECYLRRAAPSRSETDAQRRNREDRESLLWPRATVGLGSAPADPSVRWVRVCDRGADIETFMRGIAAAGQGFVIRATHDRRLMDPTARTRERVGHVFQAARAAPALGSYVIPLRGRPGQKARDARVSVSVAQGHLWPTAQSGAQGKPRQEGVPVSIVRVWEDNPPADVKRPLEWVLLTDANVDTFEQAHEVALQYQARWLVEEFHKGLKTGLGAEKLQLESGHRLFAAVAMMSVVATRLLALREDARERPDAPAATSGLTSLELLVLAKVLKRKLDTVKEVILALGRLGGHMNRKSDGLPGWQTIWAGIEKLGGYVEGFKLAQSRFGE